MSKALYDAVNAMMARIGAYGEIDTNAPEVIAVMQTLGDIDEAGLSYPWISVKDRLPKKNGQYWCYDKDEADGSGSCMPWVDWVDSGNFLTPAVTLDGKQVVIKDYAVTHWKAMERPDPPLDLKSSPPEIRGMAEGDAGFLTGH